MVNQLAGHYELLERIAEGGMGVVYRARDAHLDREVALKFLSPNLLASEEDLERFLHEARAISRLNHPNIATIYSVEEHSGERFLAFEFLSGGTLRQKIRDAFAASAPPSIPQAITWAIHIGRALAHAHRHGIVHRDVKTDNVLLTADGEVKLTDFGVAQVAGRRGAKTDQSAGSAGTAIYMSPEQAQGLEIDHRSDLFSFGSVLYEILAGRPPFQDAQEAVVLYDVSNSDPEPLDSFRDDIPESLQRIIVKLLEKDPDRRFQTADQTVAELEQLGMEQDRPSTKRHPAPAVNPTIAVLPFVDMSPDCDQEYFCDGITEEIIRALSQIPALKVVSRTSSFQFKSSAHDIREIGRQLKVETVLEGSVRKAGDTLRISVQHISVADGYHLWSERWDRDLADVFSVQDEIAANIVGHLECKLVAKTASRRPTRDVDAYNLYLEGRYYLNQRTKESLEKALDRFSQALDADHEFAAACAGSAEAHILRASASYDPEGPVAALEKARIAADRALALDDSLAEAHVARALVLYRGEWDWAGAEAEFRRAIALNDGFATAHHQYALFLAAQIRFDEAQQRIARAVELDPLSLIISTAVGRIWHFSGQLDKAVEQYQRTIRMDPEFAQAYFDLSISYIEQKEFAKARKAIATIDRLSPDPLRQAVLMTVWHAASGDRDQAVEWRDRISAAAGGRYLSPAIESIVDLNLGDLDHAMELVEKAYEQRDASLVYLRCETGWAKLRKHPRYASLIKRIGFPE